MISIVVAMDEKQLIGSKGTMPWYCPQDLQHFKRLTIRHDIVLGRKTFEKLPRMLHGRTIHVVTRNASYKRERIQLCLNIEQLLKEWKNKKEILYICGGGDVYAQSLAYADEFWISYIHGTFDGDTWFPPFSLTGFKEVMKKKYKDFTLTHYVCIKKG